MTVAPLPRMTARRDPAQHDPEAVASDAMVPKRNVAPVDTRVVQRSNATFKPRRRGLSDTRQALFEEWLDRWGLDQEGPEIDWAAAFDSTPINPFGDASGDASAMVESPMNVVLDIGFGHGESTIELARLQRDRIVIGVEVHTPGVVTVLDAIEHDPLPHVRVVHGDVLRFLGRIAPATLSGVRVFFPDPWPKQKHHQRRLIREDVVGALTERLRVGGELHLATDIAHYAHAMQVACDAEPRLEGGVIDRPTWRPVTRFEQRGLAAGRPATDLFYTRTT